MKKYEYVNVKNTTKFLSVKSEEHRKMIDKYAAKGYRYVGFIPTKMAGYGMIEEMDLIFEKDE